MIAGAGKALRLPVRAARAAAWTSVVMGSLRARQVWLTSGNDDETRNRYLRRWAEGLLALAGVDATVLGEPPPPSAVLRLVISNHRSAIDVLLLARELGGAFVKNVGGRTSMRAAMAIGEPRPATGSPRGVAAAMRAEVQRLVGAARRVLD